MSDEDIRSYPLVAEDEFGRPIFDVTDYYNRRYHGGVAVAHAMLNEDDDGRVLILFELDDDDKRELAYHELRGPWMPNVTSNDLISVHNRDLGKRAVKKIIDGKATLFQHFNLF